MGKINGRRSDPFDWEEINSSGIKGHVIHPFDFLCLLTRLSTGLPCYVAGQTVAMMMMIDEGCSFPGEKMSWPNGKNQEQKSYTKLMHI